MPPTSSRAASTIRCAVSHGVPRARRDTDRTRPAAPRSARLAPRTRRSPSSGIADRRRAQIEAAVRLRRASRRAARRRETRGGRCPARDRAADTPAAGTGCRAARSPGSRAKIASTSVQRLDDLDARAAAALIGLEQRRPADLAGVARAARATSLNVIERGVSMPSVRSSVACALLLSSSAKTSAPLSTRAPSRSSVRM